MKKSFPLLFALAALIAPVATLAAMVDATQIPDGTYTVKVDKVVDSKHLQVSMDNGLQTTLSAGRDSVDFSKIKPADQVKLSLIKGSVMVYLDLSAH